MKTYDKLVPQRDLLIGYTSFTCPWCYHSVPRGGHAEGFRKSGMHMHVAACRETLLFQQGYLPGPWDRKTGKQTVYEIMDKPDDFQRRVIRQIKATIRRRKRAGLDPRLT